MALNSHHGQTDELISVYLLEMFQQSKILRVIIKDIVKTCEPFFELAVDKERYRKFYEVFSKLEIYEDSTTVGTSLSSSSIIHFSHEFLAEYMSCMKEKQKSTYFVTGQSKEQVANSAHVVHVKKLGFAVVCVCVTELAD